MYAKRQFNLKNPKTKHQQTETQNAKQFASAESRREQDVCTAIRQEQLWNRTSLSVSVLLCSAGLCLHILESNLELSTWSSHEQERLLLSVGPLAQFQPRGKRAVTKRSELMFNHKSLHFLVSNSQLSGFKGFL